jgi:hypothetical protein
MSTHSVQTSQYPLDDKVIGLDEAAVRSGVSVSTLKRCHARGELKILKLSPRRVGIRLSDLRSWLDGRSA